MRLVEDYRRNAKDCRDLAMRMPPEQRQQLIDMAEQWDRMAEDREVAVAAEAETDG